jgi:U2 small nuclear ribonucleoprotein A'
MRLTADALSRADQFLNPLKERELHLRGLKIPTIENLAVVQDQFDIIDFSDNEIKRLDNFPKMTRLSSIIINNNYIARIGRVADNVANIKCLVLTNNRINNLHEIDNIALFKKLEHLSLLENPVVLKSNYRSFVIFKIPSLKTLDYKKITKTEKDESAKFFKSADGKRVRVRVRVRS